MSIYSYDFYHGAVLNRLINGGKSVKIMPFPSDSNSSYTINDSIGIFIKYSEKRITPWRFTFKRDHQEELLNMSELHNKLFIVFVCYNDGLTCLTWPELKKILDHNHQIVEWVSVSRSRREKYSISGSDGKLKYKIGKNDFPKKILRYID